MRNRKPPALAYERKPWKDMLPLTAHTVKNPRRILPRFPAPIRLRCYNPDPSPIQSVHGNLAQVENKIGLTQLGPSFQRKPESSGRNRQNTVPFPSPCRLWTPAFAGVTEEWLQVRKSYKIPSILPRGLRCSGCCHSFGKGRRVGFPLKDGLPRQGKIMPTDNKQPEIRGRRVRLIEGTAPRVASPKAWPPGKPARRQAPSRSQALRPKPARRNLTPRNFPRNTGQRVPPRCPFSGPTQTVRCPYPNRQRYGLTFPECDCLV